MREPCICYRVTTSSDNGRGRLTITDARKEDAGAYTCEAINNKGSIFATPDTILYVERKYGLLWYYITAKTYFVRKNIFIISFIGILYKT